MFDCRLLGSSSRCQPMGTCVSIFGPEPQIHELRDYREYKVF